jgi:hypothetical protein
MHETTEIMKLSLLNIKRHPLVVRARLAQTIVISLLIMALYWDLPDGSNMDNTLNMRDIWNKNGYLFFTVTLSILSA